MEWWHRVGQRVVCVDDEFPHQIQQRFFLPVKGRVYTIRGLAVRRSGHLCLTLREIENVVYPYWQNEPPSEMDFGAQRFRPVRETSIESLRSLLTDPPAPELLREVERGEPVRVE